MPKHPKRPRDPNVLGKLIVDLASGEKTEARPTSPAPAQEFARSGGLKGGVARAQTLTRERRQEIARLVAAAFATLTGRLAAQDELADITHPDAGTHPHQGLSFHFSKSFAGPTTLAPRLGEHTEAVLRDLLGMTDAEIAALAAADTTADVPPASAA